MLKWESLWVVCRALVKIETSLGELEEKTAGSSTEELSEKFPALPLISENPEDEEDNSDEGLLA